MESQLIGPAAALATGFSDQFSAYNPYLTKLLVPHGASVFMIVVAALLNLDHVEARGKTRKSYLERGRGA